MDGINQMIESIRRIIKKETNAYDTTATVRRIDGDTAWVHIPGGTDETPVKLTIAASAGDNVQVRVSGGKAFLVGNGSAPPTDDTAAIISRTIAIGAQSTADDAKETAEAVEGIAASAQAAATRADEAATRAEGKADDAAIAAGNAQTAAGEAQTSATNASEYAARALGNLSTVQSVAETLNWITAHGTMTNTQDLTPPETSLNPSHVYFVVDSTGDYEVGGTRYSVVTEPDVADIASYYVLSIDESLNNYVATHLAVDSEGLWIVPDAGGNKVLIATGSGSTYTTAGTYIIGKVNNVDTVFAQFTTNGMTTNAKSGTQIAHLGYGSGNTQGGGTSDAPFYSIGVRAANAPVKAPSLTPGNYSVAEGIGNVAYGYASHAEGHFTEAVGVCSHAEGSSTYAVGDSSHSEGDGTYANGHYSHAEGTGSKANGNSAHAEGYHATAGGDYSHAQNYRTKATSDYQTALGKYNIEDSAGIYVLIIGNGTADNARSNALTADWLGNIICAGNITDGAGNVLSNKADTSAIPTATSDLINDSGFISEDSNGDLSVTRNITAGGNITDGDGNILADKITAAGDNASSISISNDVIFTASKTGWLVCTLTTNSGQSIAPYAALEAYKANGSPIGIISSGWGITTNGANLTVQGPVKSGGKYRVHGVRCSIASTRIFG